MGNSRGPRVSIGRPAGWAAPGGACGFGEPPKPTPEPRVVPQKSSKNRINLGLMPEPFACGESLAVAAHPLQLCGLCDLLGSFLLIVSRQE